MSSFFSRFFALSLFLFCLSYGYAQQKYSLEITADAHTKEMLGRYAELKVFTDSATVLNYLKSSIRQMQEEGYLLAFYNDFRILESKVFVHLEAGERFDWLSLDQGNLDKGLIRKMGFRERFFQNKPFKYRQVARLQSRIIAYAEQHGYPFARLKLDSLSIEGQHFEASLNLELGPIITFDSIKVEGNTRAQHRFLEAYLGIRHGEFYDQKRIEGIGRSLSRLPYLKLKTAPRLTFQNSEARVILDLESRRINQIDGIIGFLPNARSNKLLITGQFDVELYNPFGNGRHIGMHWQKLNTNSQNLVLAYNQPNIFKGPLDFSLDFNFLKEDTLFTNRNLRLEAEYRAGSSTSISTFTDFKNTNLLATSIYEQNTTLPDLLDFQYTSYGLQFRWDGLDDAFLPKRGTRIRLEGAVGNKKIIQNNGIPAELYRDVSLRSLQYSFNFFGERYWRLGSQFVFLNRIKAGKVVNDRLFRNDAYRLGGFKTIRGFNENVFYATAYSFLTAEGRLFLDEFSYLSLFGDLGFLRSKFEGVGKTEIPIGIGAGISFSTKSGIFNFVYAVGSSESQGGFNFNQSKIHFGYISRF